MHALQDAILADQPIRVLPALDLAIPIISDEDYASHTTPQVCPSLCHALLPVILKIL